MQIAPRLGHAGQHAEALRNQELLADRLEPLDRGPHRGFRGVELTHQRQIPGGEQVVGRQPPGITQRSENRVRLGQHDAGGGDVAVAVEQLAEDQQRITQALGIGSVAQDLDRREHLGRARSLVP